MNKIPTWKRHLMSAGITFLTGFCLALLPVIDSLTLESFKTGAWIGVGFTALRAGFKAIIEAFVAFRSK